MNSIRISTKPHSRRSWVTAVAMTAVCFTLAGADGASEAVESVPEKLVPQGSPVIRRAFGFRIARIRLFAKKPLSYRDILEGGHDCRISFEYLRDVGEGRYRRRWRARLIEVGASEETATRLADLLPVSVDSGDVLDLIWSPQRGLSVRHNGHRGPPCNDLQMFQAAFNTVLGPDAPDDVPEGLLGSRPSKRIP